MCSQSVSESVRVSESVGYRGDARRRGCSLGAVQPAIKAGRIRDGAFATSAGGRASSRLLRMPNGGPALSPIESQHRPGRNASVARRSEHRQPRPTKRLKPRLHSFARGGSGSITKFVPAIWLTRGPSKTRGLRFLSPRVHGCSRFRPRSSSSSPMQTADSRDDRQRNPVGA